MQQHDAPALIGRKAYYRPKSSRPTSVALTDHAAGLLARASAEHRASRSDVVENLLRRFWRRVRFSRQVP